MRWDTTAGLTRALKKYEEGVLMLTGFKARMYGVHVPLHHHETKRSVHRAPVVANAAFYECPTCLDASPCEWMNKHRKLSVGTQRKVGVTFVKEERANHLLPRVRMSFISEQCRGGTVPAWNAPSIDEDLCCSENSIVRSLGG